MCRTRYALPLFALLTTVLAGSALAGCTEGMKATALEPAETPDIQATIEAEVGKPFVQATIDAAVAMALAATPTAIPTPTPIPTSTPITAPSPTPTTVASDKGALITCVPGWECERVNEKQLYGYGLDEVITLVNPSSYEELNSEILGAFSRREDILFFYWAPELLPAKLTDEYGGFVRLEEPRYTQECWAHMEAIRDPENVTMACGYPDAQVVIAIRTELLESAPDVVDFLRQWTLSDEGVGSLLYRLDQTGDSYEDVAVWWLQESDEWRSWVPSAIASKVASALNGGEPMALNPDKPTLVFSNLNWTTALLQNAVARSIIENGYGYPTDAVAGGSTPLLQGLAAGDTHITMEIWLPNQQAAWTEATAAGTVTEIGDSLASVAFQSAFLIPQYTADANPGLRHVNDLKEEKFWKLFVRPGS